MNERVKKVADALLYEGHMLYPYRPSSVKNQQPFTFGTLEPGESMQAECLVEGDSNTGFEVTIRCIEGVGQAFSLPVRQEFSFPPAQGTLEAKTTEIAPGLLKLTTRVENTHPNYPLTSTQAILSVRNGAFVSLTDPPEQYRAAAAQCQNIGVWAILVGDPGSRECMLASRIILSDYPEIAPESPGELFDSSEIDEILTLRILTMTDREKEEMRHTDERTRRILERTESLAPEQLMKLHGALRSPHAFEPLTDVRGSVDSVRVFGIELKRGDRVRLWPQKNADIMDLALTGKVAEIESIERDYEDKIHFAVILDDDPGRDMGALRQPGHRFFFSPEEVEPLELDRETR